MSIRVTALYLYVLGFGWYARRFWFVSCCAAVALMAFIQHPDLPKSIGGIQGLNPWNMLFAVVGIFWLIHRTQFGWRWEMPPYLNFFLFTYLVVVMISVGRLMSHPTHWSEESLMGMLSEYVINGVKWVLPGLLIFDGCRNRNYALIAIGAILTIYLLLGVQVIRWVPFGSGQGKASRYIQNEIGYNRVTLSMMLSGASWAMLSTVLLFDKWRYKIPIAIAAGSILFAQAITGGRSGYASWLGIGLIFALVRWRKLLLLLPAAVVLVIAFVPGVKERVFQGASDSDGPIVVQKDAYELTSGRNIAWPVVIDKIWEEPILGYGREGMSVSGAQQFLMDVHGESFPHPHQAYLEWLLDNGIVGFLLVIPLYFVLLGMAFKLMRDREDALVAVIGSMSFALILALMIGAFGGQTFYPREGSVGMWAATGLMIRCWVERQRQPTGRIFEEEILEPEIVDESETLEGDGLKA